MKTFLNILGVLLMLVGGVWFFQGLKIIQGSPMTGKSQWVYIGAAAVVIGIGLLVFANLRKVIPPKN
jgi:hypothetical protein